MFIALACSMALALPAENPVVPGVDPREFILSADDWARPRTGARVVGIAAVRDAVAAWLQNPTSRIVLLYAGGESGVLWVSEVRDWMVALGIANAMIEPRPGSAREDEVVIRLEGAP